MTVLVRLLAAATGSALVAPLLTVSAPAAAAATQIVPAAAPCRTGTVALTFDDGPEPRLTPRLVGSLEALQAPATFFMVGQRVRSAPAAARRVAGSPLLGVGNHTWAHQLLTSQSDAGIRLALARTDRAMRVAGVPPSRLMRPPYGGIDRRVARVVRGTGRIPVLWDVDPRDWERRSAAGIAAGVLSRLRPGPQNVVLQHDGVRNSPNSVAAVPRIVRTARQRGYCFARLGTAGRPRLVVPRVRLQVTPRGGTVHEGRTLRVQVRLDLPSERVTRLVLRTVDDTAQAGEDYRARRWVLRIPPRRRGWVLRVPTRADTRPEPREHLLVRATNITNARLVSREVRLTIRRDR